MVYKSLKLTCGSSIDIYQNIFTAQEQNDFYMFAVFSKYMFGNHSDIGYKSSKLGSFHSCIFSDEEDNDFGLNKHEFIKKIVHNRSRVRSWINGTLAGSRYYPHTDGYVFTILYYINTIWDTDNGGETLFYNMYGEKELAIDFVPGQIVAFDGRLKHKPGLVQWNPDVRYVYTCQYKNHE
jgi:hypothetical protein